MSLPWLPVEFRIQYKLFVTVLRRLTGRHHHTYWTLQKYVFRCGHCGQTIEDFLSDLVFAQNNMEMGGLTLVLLYFGTVSRQI